MQRVREKHAGEIASFDQSETELRNKMVGTVPYDPSDSSLCLIDRFFHRFAIISALNFVFELFPFWNDRWRCGGC